MNDNQKRMIEDFQCPGCVCGSNTECDSCLFFDNFGFGCKGHVAGTVFSPGGKIFLGLPKGFNKVGPIHADHPSPIRLWENGKDPEWDKFNVPVWYMEESGYLFVRTFCPRINTTYIDILQIEDNKPLPSALKEFHSINVGEFLEDID